MSSYSHHHDRSRSGGNNPANPALAQALESALLKSLPNAERFLALTLDSPDNDAEIELGAEALNVLASCEPKEIDHLLKRITFTLRGGDLDQDYILLGNVGLALVSHLTDAQKAELAQVVKVELETPNWQSEVSSRYREFLALTKRELALREQYGDRNASQRRWRDYLVEKAECLVEILGHTAGSLKYPLSRLRCAEMLIEHADVPDKQLGESIVGAIGNFIASLAPREQLYLVGKLKGVIPVDQEPWRAISDAADKAATSAHGEILATRHFTTPEHHKPITRAPQFTIPELGLKQLLRELGESGTKDDPERHQGFLSLIAPFLYETAAGVRALAFKRLNEYFELVDQAKGLEVSKELNLVTGGQGTPFKPLSPETKPYPPQARPEVLSFLSLRAEGTYKEPELCGAYLCEMLKIVLHEYRKFILPQSERVGVESIEKAAAFIDKAVAIMGQASCANSLVETFIDLVSKQGLSQFGDADSAVRASFQRWLPYSQGGAIAERTLALFKKHPELGVCSNLVPKDEKSLIKEALERIYSLQIQ